MAWRDAHVGADSQHVAVRVTEEEKDRLEQLRRDLRLTSKGQVIRAALDLLEQFGVAGEVVTGGDVEFVRRAARRHRRDKGVPHRRDVELAQADDAAATRGRVVVTSYEHVIDQDRPAQVGDAGGLPDGAATGSGFGETEPPHSTGRVKGGHTTK